VQPEPIDLLHLGREHLLCAWRLEDVIVDPGPSSCIPALLAALDDRPPRALALTHIHLDHAGAAGSLARRFEDLEVWVHERGARHLLDPSRLIDSATRLYGREMERLWGEVLPVPESRLRVLHGGETLGAFRVAYTPGHASHHVAYHHEQSGWAFTGDVAGVRIGAGPVLPPTPPPDIDLALWRDSLDVLAEWQPRALALAHFGAYTDVHAHLQALRDQLERVEAIAAHADEGEYAAAIRALVSETADAHAARAYEQAMPLDQSFQGLERYLERRNEKRGPAGSD
jgi:glyoxylase-like metal-dependent hydrolase (beta-lactamase superfamily II)